MTIFAQFDNAINKALSELKEVPQNKRDNIEEEKKREFSQMLANFEETYTEQAKMLTEKMNNPELAQQAQTLVRGIIGQIYRKSMNKWEELQATATLENSLTQMLHDLKKLVFDSRIYKKELNI